MKNKIKLFTIFLFGITVAFADNEVFDRQDVSGKDFSSGSYANSSWKGCIATGTIFSSYDYSSSTLSYTNYTNADFSNANLTNADFNSAILTNANFTGAILIGAHFGSWDTPTNLSTVNFTNAKINGASFKDSEGLSASQVETTWSYKNKDFTDVAVHADISSLDLTDFNITGANFNDTNLRKEQLYSTANYKNKNLSGVGFYTGNYSGWNFVGQNLQNTSWKLSNYDNADVSFADLRGAHCDDPDPASKGIFITKNTIMDDGVIKDFSMKSASDSFSIRKYVAREYYPERVSAKISENDVSISGGAKLTLEQGASFEVANGKTLTVASDGSMQIDADFSNSTIFKIGSNSGLNFENGAILTVNIVDDITVSDTFIITVLSFEDDSRITSLDSFVKDETLFLTIKGEKFNGAWDYSINGNALLISMQVPEPATVAAIFGALALGSAVYRKRR